jgi:hypothetical protein
MLDSLTFRHLKKGYQLHVYTASVGFGERDTHEVHIRTAGNEKFKVIYLVRPWTAADGVILAI